MFFSVSEIKTPVNVLASPFLSKYSTYVYVRVNAKYKSFVML